MSIWQSINSKQSSNYTLQVLVNAEQFMLILLHQDLALEIGGNIQKQNETIVISLGCHFLQNQQEKRIANGTKCLSPQANLAKLKIRIWITSNQNGKWYIKCCLTSLILSKTQKVLSVVMLTIFKIPQTRSKSCFSSLHNALSLYTLPPVLTFYPKF